MEEEKLIQRIPSPVLSDKIRSKKKMADFKKTDCKTIGLVIYQDVNNEDERRQPFLTTQHILDWAVIHFEKYKVLEYCVAAEVGKKNKHYHYQCVFQFETRILKNKGYERFSINGIKCFLTYEKGRNFKSLAVYCKKDGDYLASAAAEAAIKKEAVNHAEELLQIPTKSLRIEYIIKECPSLITKGTLPKTLEAIEMVERIRECHPSSGYVFPEYLMELEDADLIYKWFNGECIIEKPRRKALVLYSKERAIGKTMLAKAMAGGQEDDYIICRGNFNSSQFQKEKPRMLILDDMNFMSGQLEMWKALCTGERVSIRDAYCNVEFKHGLPTIITTNSYKTFKFMLNSEYFANDCYFCWVRKYIGPPGTERENDPERFRNFTIEDLLADHTEIESMIEVGKKRKMVEGGEVEEKYRQLKIKKII